MNQETLNQKANSITSIFLLKENADKGRTEMENMIKPILSQIAKKERDIGRRQVLNHISGEIDKLWPTEWSA